MHDVDLVVAFRASHKHSLSKQQTRDDARKAEQQYSRLLETLSYAGLSAVGRRGEGLGHLLVFIRCPDELVQNLARRERQADFLSGLPTTPVASNVFVPLSPSERVRLVYEYVASIPSDGGLGIIPGVKEWDLVESLFCLHDKEFNDQWIHAWTHSRIVSVAAERIRDQFGDSVALYFSFLYFYSFALWFPAILGVVFFYFGTPYSPIYSTLLVLWAVGFVEYWRIKERLISLRFGTRGSFKVEKRRVQYTAGFPWWKREMRIFVSLPVIVLFASVLITLLTVTFLFEAFVSQLYTGPGHQYVAFLPTMMFALISPRVLALYQSYVQRFTAWENHAHYSSHASSLTLKTFALSALVAYLGLALSAFVYVPFGEGIMRMVQIYLFHRTKASEALNAEKISMWDSNIANAGGKLNPGRLRDQMFAYTVTQQVVNTFMEIGLPYVLRAVGKFRNGKTTNGLKKKVVFEDEREKGGMQEREFLEGVRKEAALPEYDLFSDYNEMVTQFGYVVLWSTIWPLAPAMALLNNILELRSDAFKITVHTRRPMPTRVDTIGPWLDTLTFLVWMATLTNSALVYMFCPRAQCGEARLSPLEKVHQQLFNTTATLDNFVVNPVNVEGAKELILTALLIALVSSHGYFLLRVLVRHVLERVVWKGDDDVKEREREERDIKERFLKGLLGSDELMVGSSKVNISTPQSSEDDAGNFWDHDEGIQEIQRISKEA